MIAFVSENNQIYMGYIIVSVNKRINELLF